MNRRLSFDEFYTNTLELQPVQIYDILFTLNSGNRFWGVTKRYQDANSQFCAKHDLETVIINPKIAILPIFEPEIKAGNPNIPYVHNTQKHNMYYAHLLNLSSKKTSIQQIMNGDLAKIAQHLDLIQMAFDYSKNFKN